MISLFVLGLVDLDLEKKFPLRFNPAIRSNLAQFWSYRPYFALTLFFFIVLFSGLYSEDQGYWLERLRLKIPFLLFPFAFASIPPINRRQYLGIFYFLLLLLFFSSLQVSFYYWQNFEEVNKLMKQGHPMQTPMSHIRYSLMMALSILGGCYLILQNYYWKYRWERHLIRALTICLFFFIHILSVRSGLLTLYLALICLSLVYVFRTGKMWIGILTMIALISLPIFAYRFIPSFNAKTRYALYDLEMYLSGTEGKYSDSERIISLELGKKIGLQHPLFGVGAGDLRQEVQKQYAETYPELPAKMPHNQLVSVFAGTGLVGLVIFCFTFFYPLFYQHNYRLVLHACLHLVIFVSFMMENTLETSIGVALYLVLLLVSLNYLSGRTQDISN